MIGALLLSHCCWSGKPAIGTLMQIDVDAILALDEPELLKQCRFEAFKSGGPGGQKRNKTSSAARMIHVPTGLVAQSSDFRSQVENRKRALHRLRYKLAAELRTPLDSRGYAPPAWVEASKTMGKFTTNTKNPIHARLAAHVLDVLAAVDGRHSAAAALLGVSNSNLEAFLRAEHTVWAATSRLSKRS